MQRVRPRRTRHGRERALLTILGSLTCLFGLATLVVGYVGWSLTRIDRIDVAESLTVATDAPVTAADIIAAADSPPPGLGIAAAEEEGEPGFSCYRLDVDEGHRFRSEAQIAALTADPSRAAVHLHSGE